MMQKEQIHRILKEFAKNNHSPELRQKFGKWLTNMADEDEKEKVLLELWKSIQSQANETTLIDFHSLRQQLTSKSPKTHKLLLKRISRVAAIIAIPLICSLTTYLITRKSLVSEIRFTELYVDNGDKKYVVLPDGTKAWINSGSYLIYPNEFPGNSRTVYLAGEANFNVAKNPDKPFLVHTNHLTIEALGTVFNIQAYTDVYKTTTTLEEGKVKVTTKTKNPDSFILYPNEQIEYSARTKKATRKMVDSKRMAMWKEGYLVFQAATLEEIIHGISKRFDVVTQYDSGKYAGKTFTVRFAPDDTLQETMNIMKEIIKDFNYTIKDKTIFIY